MINFTKKQYAHLNSNRQTGIKRYVLLGLFSILLCQPCLANPIAMDLEYIMLGPAGYGVVLDALRVIAVDLLIDLAVLIVGYILIRKIRCLKSKRFFPYLIAVVLGGLVIDETALLFGNQPDNEFLSVFMFTFLLLFSFNYFLSWAFYRLPYKKAAVIAILMGLLTHPDFYSAYSWMPIVGVLLFLTFCSYARKPHYAKKDSTTSQQTSPAVSATSTACQDKHPKPEIGLPE